MKKLLLLHTGNKDEERFVFLLNDKKSIEKLEWEGDNEFSLDGEMYDVIEKKIQDGKLIIRCINDKKETVLVKNYEKLNHENNSKSKSALLLKLLDSSYLPEVNNLVYINCNLALLHISFQQGIFSSYRKDVLTPPPQVS
jgi:predicted transcriptional regulator